MLIDFDASGLVGYTNTSTKFTSAYLPPELIYVENDNAVVRRLDSPSDGPEDDLTVDDVTTLSPSQKIPSLLVSACPTPDVWALGLVLYELCSGMKFFIQVILLCSSRPGSVSWGRFWIFKTKLIISAIRIF
jgi:serine/threonine protein kinase